MFCSILPQRNRSSLLLSPAPGTSQTQQEGAAWGALTCSAQLNLTLVHTRCEHSRWQGQAPSPVSESQLFCSQSQERNRSCQLNVAKKSQAWDRSGEALPPKQENCCSRHCSEGDLQSSVQYSDPCVQDKNKPMMGTNEETSGENRAQPLAGDQNFLI